MVFKENSGILFYDIDVKKDQSKEINIVTGFLEIDVIV